METGLIQKIEEGGGGGGCFDPWISGEGGGGNVVIPGLVGGGML